MRLCPPPLLSTLIFAASNHRSTSDAQHQPVIICYTRCLKFPTSSTGHHSHHELLLPQAPAKALFSHSGRGQLLLTVLWSKPNEHGCCCPASSCRPDVEIIHAFIVDNMSRQQQGVEWTKFAAAIFMLLRQPLDSLCWEAEARGINSEALSELLHEYTPTRQLR